MNVKNKFKLLLQKDTTVSLLCDEIHLKLYFDYKGGNIIGLFNSNEAATSASVFMLSSVFSQYEDTVYVMPTKYLNPATG